MIPPADNTAARAPHSDTLADTIADIDATIEHWRERGLRASDIGEQLHCARRWPWIRQRMIALAAPKKKPTSSAIVALIGMRRYRGLSQADVADRLGISRRSISAYENRFRIPGEEILAAWRAELGLRALAATPQIGA